jgi:hypothetical protein
VCARVLPFSGARAAQRQIRSAISCIALRVTNPGCTDAEMPSAARGEAWGLAMSKRLAGRLNVDGRHHAGLANQDAGTASHHGASPETSGDRLLIAAATSCPSAKGTA